MQAKTRLKENMSEGDGDGDDEQNLRISVRERIAGRRDSTHNNDDQELDIEIISKEVVEADKTKDNLIVVDLTASESPTPKLGDPNKPILNI